MQDNKLSPTSRKSASNQASVEDFTNAQCSLARANSFNSLSNVEKLYYLMVIVNKPTDIAVMQTAARLNGISPGELCSFLKDYKEYFYEIESNTWVTSCYAEDHELIQFPEIIREPEPSAQPVLRPSELLEMRRIRPVKNGITCMSMSELESVAVSLCQTLHGKSSRADICDRLHLFMSRLTKPARAGDIEKVFFETFGHNIIAKTTFRKYLSEHPSLYTAPTHGVWCTTELAQSLGYVDWRKRKQ